MRCPMQPQSSYTYRECWEKDCAWWVSEWRAPSIADSDRGIRRFTREGCGRVVGEMPWQMEMKEERSCPAT